MKNKKLISELISIYLLLPTALILLRENLRGAFIPILLVLSGLAFRHLHKDPTFDRSAWLSRAKNGGLWKRLIFGAVFLLAILAVFRSELLFELPCTRPITWLAVCLLYPLVSVYPQELLYRAFFFHRYRPLFSSERTMIWINAALFGYLHLIFGNGTAVLLTTAGGWLFASTYLRTRSVWAVSIEHALWGMLLFTIGYSHYFTGATIPIP
jgi:membrane protease YdiL (CAAX protease family)